MHSYTHKMEAAGSFECDNCSGVPRVGVGVFKPPLEIPKALQNRAKLNPIVKTVKNC